MVATKHDGRPVLGLRFAEEIERMKHEIQAHSERLLNGKASDQSIYAYFQKLQQRGYSDRYIEEIFREACHSLESSLLD